MVQARHEHDPPMTRRCCDPSACASQEHPLRLGLGFRGLSVAEDIGDEKSR